MAGFACIRLDFRLKVLQCRPVAWGKVAGFLVLYLSLLAFPNDLLSAFEGWWMKSPISGKARICLYGGS